MAEAQATAPQTAVPKRAPISMAKLLTLVDNSIDATSSKTDKKERASGFFNEFKSLHDEAQNELQNEKKNTGSPKLPDLQRVADYFSILFGNTCNLINSFESMQTIWHAKVNEITNYAISKITAGSIWDNIAKRMPKNLAVLSGSAVGAAIVATAYSTGAWAEILKLVKGIAPQPVQNVYALGAYIIGALLVAGVATSVNQFAASWQHKKRVKRDNALQTFFKEEGAVRIAIRETVKQLKLGLDAEGGCAEDLQRSGDDELLRNMGPEHLAAIWKIVNERINRIHLALPEAIRDFFQGSLSLPDYATSVLKADEQKAAPAATETKPPST